MTSRSDQGIWLTKRVIGLANQIAHLEIRSRRSIHGFLVGYFPSASPERTLIGALRDSFSQDLGFFSSHHISILIHTVATYEKAVMLGVRVAKEVLADPNDSKEGILDKLVVQIMEDKRNGV